jgi:hypothetical protein
VNHEAISSDGGVGVGGSRGSSGQTLALRVHPAEQKDMPDLALIILLRPIIMAGSPPEPALWVPEEEI